MEQKLDRLNQKTMKEVWEHYNSSLNYRAQVNIKLENEQERT